MKGKIRKKISERRVTFLKKKLKYLLIACEASLHWPNGARLEIRSQMLGTISRFPREYLENQWRPNIYLIKTNKKQN